MEPVQIILATTLLLCSLVTGLLLAFAIVVMPGINTLGDRDFLRAFKVMDRVIQNNQPIFMLLWAGSVLGILILLVGSFFWLEGIDLVLIVIAAALYLFGVQLPTAIVNIPLNNWLQALHLDSQTETELQNARKRFEPRWTRWNTIRTIFATITSVLLILT